MNCDLTDIFIHMVCTNALHCKILNSFDEKKAGIVKHLDNLLLLLSRGENSWFIIYDIT